MGVELALMALGTGLSMYNNERTVRRQDRQAALAVQNQGRRQREIDTQVADEVAQLQGSTGASERAQALQGYMETLTRNRRAMEAGLSPNVGSAAFRDDSGQAATDVTNSGGRWAQLMSRIDAPAMQRQREGFGYGNLATRIGQIARNAQGDAQLDELRMRAIRKNPWLDAAGGALTAYGASRMGAASGAGSGAESFSYAPVAQGGRAVYGAYNPGLRYS